MRTEELTMPSMERNRGGLALERDIFSGISSILRRLHQGRAPVWVGKPPQT